MSALPDRAPGASRPGRAGPAEGAGLGLRERKKIRTRAAIREHAFRLFHAQGYEATTVEQIAEAAEVSPSTFFRYFPTKEDVVLQDDMELLWVDALRAQPPDVPLRAAIRASLHGAFARISPDDMARLHTTTEFALSVPAVRARMLDEFARTMQVMSAAVAERTGRDPADFKVRTLVGAILGVAMSAWFTSMGDMERFMAEFEHALAFLEEGLPL